MAAENLPAAQSVQSPEPAGELLPASHGVQESNPEPAQRPASHVVQLGAPSLVLDHEPASHLVHTLLPGSE